MEDRSTYMYIEAQKKNFETVYSQQVVTYATKAYEKFDKDKLFKSTSVAVRKPAKECQFTLADGRAITLVQVSQHLTQRGVYEGLQHPCASIADAVLAANVLVGKLEQMPVVLKGEVLTGSFSSSAADTWIAMPAVTTIAVFESDLYARDPSANSSLMCLIWFTHDFGLHIDKLLADQIEALDWRNLANDCFL